jgi:hypothetical protein
MASIVVSGYILRHPFSGAATSCMHYLLGLAMLGNDVLYVEGSGWPHSCPGAPASPPENLPRASLACVRETLRAGGAEASVVWVDEDAGLVEGMVWPQLRKRVANADLLLDVGGACMLEERPLVRRRALVAIDPVLERLPDFPRADYDVRFSYRTNAAPSGRGVPSDDARLVLERALEEAVPRRLPAAA